MIEKEDDKFMRRCIGIARNAEGMTYPNPLVGSVIVHDGKIIGEGYHLMAGQPHAEVNAINSVKDKNSLKTSSIYVNLEPCSHFGKTPPCADLIIASSIPRVVIGTIDTSDKVKGKGIEKLKSAGCDVVTGVVEEEARWLNRRFFTFNEKKRPYIILKWAESADGFIDIVRESDSPERPTWISGKPERALVHKWRSEEQSILVGANTLRADRPHLNVRDWKGKDPLRLVLTGGGSIFSEQWIPDYRGNTVFFTRNKDLMIAEGFDIVRLEGSGPACFEISNYLHQHGIQSLFIEGGAETLNHFISNGLWDEARVFTGNTSFDKGVRAPEISGKLLENRIFSGSTLNIYHNNGSI